MPEPDGSELQATAASEGRSERRVLTALCYDMVGSTDLLGQLDIEDFQDLMAAFQRAARQAISSFSGLVRLEAGDGGIALFPLGIDAKDAASLAIKAGLGVVQACKRVGAEKGRPDLQVRVGVATSMSLVNTGDVDPWRDSVVTGAAFALATRLQVIAQPDTVLVSDETRNLARRSHAFSFRGTHQIKGFAAPERVWRALSHKRELDRFFAFGRVNGQLVGRAHELDLIAERWNEARAGNGGAILIEGEPGIGKSRVLYEFRKSIRAQRARVLLFQCRPSGTQSTLHPLLQNVMGDLAGGKGPLSAVGVAEAFGSQDVDDPDVIDIFSFLLGAAGTNPDLRDADPETIRDKANWALRRSIETICANGPLALLIEDIHWIDQTSKRLLMELAQFIHRYPALVVATTRPGSGGWLQARDLRHILLEPLDREETRQAINALWRKSGVSVPPALLETVERVTGGVPLFIEETCQWIVENASATSDGLAQAVSPGHASVFETVLNARLEPLGPAKEIAAAAAVAGNRFDQRLLRELLPDFDDRMIADALDGLNDAGFLVKLGASAGPVYGFRHALIQETIYKTLLRKKRQALHQRLYTAVSRNRSLAAWLGTAAVAEHAEQAGLVENAIEQFVSAGMESSSRSSMAEARQLLEHAIALCGHINDPIRHDTLQLSAMVALGPILTASEGPNSAPARKLYEDGVAIARRRPVAERAKWFPIYWGWWFTGPVVDSDRASAVVSDLKDVEDTDVQLQARHCVWAVEFYAGRHENCIAAVETGLPLYGAGQGKPNATLFGGHDAKVCGLAHRSLSLWFTGKPTSAIHAMFAARHWAQRSGHVASITHALINEAMLHSYRRDFRTLRTVIADIRQLAGRHHLPSLAVAAQIFEGWCDGNAGNVERGRDTMRQGLGLHGEFQTPEDEPVYCGMLAELMTRTGEVDGALALLRSATVQAEAGGSRYWLAELHRRTAQLLLLRGASAEDIAAAFEKSLATADEQNAVPFLIATHEALCASQVSPELALRYRDRVEAAKAALEPGAALIVDPEPVLRQSLVPCPLVLTQTDIPLPNSPNPEPNLLGQNGST